MLAVSARRQGLLLSVWAKPTLYVAFSLSGGAAQAGASAKPAAPAADVMSNLRRVMIIVILPSRKTDAVFSPPVTARRSSRPLAANVPSLLISVNNKHR